jgi:group I intron endonuclease
MSQFLVYVLEDPITGQFRYVGLSTRGMKRPEDHLRAVRKNEHTHRANWLRSVKAQGFQPVIHIMGCYDNEDDVNDAEVFWIAHLRFSGCSLTNHTSGGGARYRLDEITKQKISVSRTGYKHSDETRQLMSKSRMGESNPHFGKKHSAETLAEMSVRRAGRKFPNRKKGTMSEGSKRTQFKPGIIPWNAGLEDTSYISGANHPMYGRHHSEESKAKIRETKRQRRLIQALQEGA